MNQEELFMPLGKITQYHIFCWLYQTHPSLLHSKRKLSLLNVTLNDLLENNRQVKQEEKEEYFLSQTISTIVHNLFTQEEIREHEKYMEASFKIYQLSFPNNSSSSSSSNKIEKLNEYRKEMIEKYLLNQPFLLQDFLLHLVKQIISLQRQGKKEQIEEIQQPLISLPLTTPIAGKQLLSISFHLKFQDERRSDKQLKLDIEQLPEEAWKELIQSLKQRIFQSKDLEYVKATSSGTCTNGKLIQWYVEFLVPSEQFDSVEYFHPTLLQHFYFPLFKAQVYYMFVSVKTNWFEILED